MSVDTQIVLCPNFEAERLPDTDMTIGDVFARLRSL